MKSRYKKVLLYGLYNEGNPEILFPISYFFIRDTIKLFLLKIEGSAESSYRMRSNRATALFCIALAHIIVSRHT